MKGIVKDVYAIYDSNDKQLIIPVYQRNYDWRTKHCEQLMVDLAAMVRDNRPKHFFGAVVGKSETAWTWIVIDGQQRLTTVSLLMLALSKCIAEGTVPVSDHVLGTKILESYLLNGGRNGEAKFRLKPVKNDAHAYNRLFEDESQWIESSNVTANFRYFLAAIPASGLTADELWAAISNLEVMHLDLENHDDPQRIFESLNSTGLALSESDKIRNLVLMDLDSAEQNRVYNQFWNQIEENVEYDTDNFIRWYLVTKTAKTPRFDQIYESFKTFAVQTGLKGEGLLSEVRDYSVHYMELRRSRTGIPEADGTLRRLNIMKQDVILPLIMPLLAEHRSGSIDATDFCRSLRIVETYLARRMICNHATNALNAIFAKLYREVRKLRTDGSAMSDVLAYALTRRSGTGIFPTDDEFIHEFRTRDFYHISADRRRYVFDSLENGLSRETNPVEDSLQKGALSIEHVMPQTMTAEWRQALGQASDEIHEEWLHRIGNLTITGYNSKYSNASFKEKKSMKDGFDGSPYRLNAVIKASQSWGLPELKERTAQLLNSALELWPYPTSTFTPSRAVVPVEELGHDTDFTHRDIVAFTFNDTHKTVASWREMFVEVLKNLAERNLDKLLQYARTSEAFRFFSESEAPNKSWSYIAGGLYVWGASNTSSKMYTLRQVLTHFDIDPSEIAITLRDSNQLDSDSDDTVEDHTYAALTKFISPFAEASDAQLGPSETGALRAEFESQFKPFRVTHPLKELGCGAATFAADDVKLANATERQILALVSAKLIEQETLDPEALHNTILSGELSRWLTLLKHFRKGH